MVQVLTLPRKGVKLPIQTELPVQDTGRVSPVVVWESCAGMWKGMVVDWPEIWFSSLFTF